MGPAVGPNSRKILPLALLILLAYLQFFYHLDAIGLVGPDEPRYAQVAREMVTSGDYITPRLAGKPWFEKPVLYYWMTALAYRLRGVDESSARMASALCAALGVGLTYCLGRAWIGHRGGWTAALILATSPLYFSLGRAASMDMLLTLSLTGAWTSLYHILFSDSTAGPQPSIELGLIPRFGVYGFYFFLGLSLLAKGPVGLALTGGSLGLFILLNRQFGLLRRLLSIWGIVLFLAVCLPWYLLCYQANGFSFIQDFVIQHNLERFTTDRYKHAQPFWFYLGVVVAGFFPWTFQLVLPLLRLLRGGSRKVGQERWKGTFFGLWAAVPLVFFTFSRAKLPGYILPIAPAIALIIAKEWENRRTGCFDAPEDRWFSRLVWSQLFCLILLGIALPFGAAMLRIEIRPVVPHLMALLIGTGILGLLFARKSEFGKVLVSLTVGTVATVLMIVTLLLPQIDRLESCRQIGAHINRQGYQGRQVFVLGLSRRIEYGLLFYLNRPIRLIYSSDDLRAFQGEEILLVTPRETDLQRVLPGWKLVRESSFDDLRIASLSHEAE